MGDLAHRLRRQVDDSGNHWSRQARRQLLQGDGSQNHSNLLDARPQKTPQLLEILGGDVNLDGAS